jgi:osmoprotectant transport system ATP-binding protein
VTDLHDRSIPPDEGPLIQLRQVTCCFGPVQAVDAIDLQVARGRTTVLIGPSGCGKSTILRLIVGLATPESGSVLFDNREICPANAVALRRRMGYVIQEGGLFPHLTARANLTLLARHLGWERQRYEARLQALGELARLPASLLERFPAELSGGQRQRVALMRALMLGPEALLLDEPLGSLDPMVRAGLQDELRELFQRLGTTVLLVTHDLQEAAYLGDDIVLMRSGRVVQKGAFRDLSQTPAEPFVTRFISAQRARVSL